MEQEFGFYAVIPVYILQDKTLRANAKLLYGQISALTNKTGYCYASDKKLGEDLGIHQKSIYRLLSELEQAGYIKRETKKDVSGTWRRIYLSTKIPTYPQGGNRRTAVRGYRQNAVPKEIKDTKINNKHCGYVDKPFKRKKGLESLGSIIKSRSYKKTVTN